MRIRHFIYSSLVCIGLSFNAPAALGALNAYLTLTGDIQGLIKGESLIVGRKDTIEITGFSHTVVSSRDTRCLPVPRFLQHQPVVITKPIDRSTPRLMTAHANNENLTAQIDFYRPGLAGGDELYYTIKLVNAHIAGIRQEQLNNLVASNANFPLMENVSLTYDSIQKTWVQTADTAQDVWNADCSSGIQQTDLNFDGIVNILDFTIMANQWMLQSNFF